ncbi:hypothetical protein ACC691_37510, partial [Rhizobium johnstonii]|uniref:hypothetical protein n=1 Tax=Rhizobium johnstonii TaxID=3019933 RepID=UPI003F9C8E7B
WVTTEDDLAYFAQGTSIHQLLDVPGATNVVFDAQSNDYDLSIVNEGGLFYLDGDFTISGGWGITLTATVDGQDFTQTFTGTAAQGLPSFPRDGQEVSSDAQFGDDRTGV